MRPTMSSRGFLFGENGTSFRVLSEDRTAPGSRWADGRRDTPNDCHSTGVKG